MELHDSWTERLNVTNVYHLRALYTFKKPYQNSKNSFLKLVKWAL